jgi:stearoyl-CoA desaturase (delta-9 desaturase)
VNKNSKTAINIISQRLLVVISFVGFFFSILYAVFYNQLILLLVSFLIGKFIVSALSTQIALHRYFSHRSFETTPIKHKFLAWVSILAGQGSPVGWSAHHRHHHANADTELDTHSPRESKWLAAGLWLMKSYEFYINVKKLRRVPTDLLRDTTVRYIDDHYYKIWLGILLVSFIISWKFAVFIVLSPLAWGYINAAVITLGANIKLPGSYRNFDTPDNSYNNKWMQVYMLGEGLHNNHHHNPNKYDEKVCDDEFDLIGLTIQKVFKNT